MELSIDEVYDLLDGMTLTLGLDSNDALILSTGARAGVESVVTRDKQFDRALGTGWIDPMAASAPMCLLGQT